MSILKCVRCGNSAEHPRFVLRHFDAVVNEWNENDLCRTCVRHYYRWLGNADISRRSNEEH